MTKEKLSIVLGEYDEQFKLYGAYQVLLRALIESKFATESFDDRIMYSTTLADIANELVLKMDQLGVVIKIQGVDSQRRWLTIRSPSGRAYTTALHRLRSTDEGREVIHMLRNISEQKRTEMINIIFSPFVLENQLRSGFLQTLFDGDSEELTLRD